MSELCSAGILGTGHYAPEKILSNADLERMVDTSDEWIRTRTGIQERRIAAETELTSTMGTAAARRALESAGVQIDLRTLNATLGGTVVDLDVQSGELVTAGMPGNSV